MQIPNKIKICHLIEDLGRGGAEKRLLNDLKYLDKDKFTNYVWYLFSNNTLEREFNSLGIQTECLNFKKKNIRSFKSIFRLLRFIIREKIDIIHTQLFFADILGRLVGVLCYKPVISTIQSSAYEQYVKFLYSKKRLLIDRLTTKLFNDKIIAVSEFVKSSIKKKFTLKDEKIDVIYNSVEDEANQLSFSLVNNYRNKFKNHSDLILLLTVGKLNPGKGHRYLIRALAELKNKKIRLLLAGTGNLKSELEYYAEHLGISDRVLFLGEVKNIKELIAICDIFVFPTLSEGMPLSLLEAMVQKKPIIASNIRPIREAIQDGINGILVPAKDFYALAHAIEYLLKHTQKAEDLGKSAREIALEKFNAKIAAEKLGKLYESIVRKERI